MGKEKKAEPNNETEKKNDAPASVVFKLDLHCEGCVKKIKKAVSHFDGVEDVKADISANKLTVIGKIDPAKLRDKLAEKIKKNVDLVSSKANKDTGADKLAEKVKKNVDLVSSNANKDAGADKPPVKKSDEKKPKKNTVVLKTRVHCDGCIQKIRKIILKFKGAESVDIDGGKDLITVEGTMDVKELVSYLKEKLKRNVEIVPTKKEKEKEEGENEKKKNKENGGKKEEGAVKVEVNKMEHHGYGYRHDPMYVETSSGYNGNYEMDQVYNQQQEEPYYYGMHPQNYPPPPQMFSDENPNACTIM